jgi:hypothetical protein
MSGRNWLAIAFALVLAAVAFVWLEARSVGPKNAGLSPRPRAAPEVPKPQGEIRAVEPQPAEPQLEGAPGPARTQVESDRSVEPSQEDAKQLQDALRIAVRLTTSTGEPLDGYFKDDGWHGGYVSQITVVPTSEPLPNNVSTLKLERLRCGTYTRSWAARNTSFSGIVPDDISGIIDLSCQPPAYANAMLRGRVLASATIEATTREVVLVIDPGRALATLGGVTFRLMDASTFEPIAKAGVSLTEGVAGEAEWANPYQLALEDGRFERQRLPPGFYELQIRLPGFEHLVRNFNVNSGLTTDLGELLIEEGCAVRGRVIDDAGNGLSVPLVWAERSYPNFIRMGGSDADGQFVMAELPPGGVTLQVAGPEWAIDPLMLPLQPGAIVEDVVLVARRGILVTLNTQAASDTEYRLVLNRNDGIDFWHIRALGTSSHQVRLVPGLYALRGVINGAQQSQLPFTVTDQPMTVDLKL